MTEPEINILSAMLGRSNMGHGLPPVDRVRQVLRHSVGLLQMVETFNYELFEGPDDWEPFYEEAQGWKRRILKRSDDQIKKEFAEALALLEAARKQSASS